MRFEAIRQLADTHPLDVALVAQERLAEITSTQGPGERWVACDHPLVAQERQRKRHAWLEATAHDLAAIVREVARRPKSPLGQAEMGQKVGQGRHHDHRAKPCTVQSEDKRVSSARRPATRQREAALAGRYVIRTSEPTERLSAAAPVRG